MHILGIGIDLLDISRIQGLIQRRGLYKFMNKTLTNMESELFASRFPDLPDLRSSQELEAASRWLGIRWAVKESIYKAMPMAFQIGWKECSVLGGNGGPLKVEFHDENAPTISVQANNIESSHDPPSTTDKFKDLECFASVSHEGNLLIANALISSKSKK